LLKEEVRTAVDRVKGRGMLLTEEGKEEGKVDDGR
jgi:hypothetical protein